MSFRDKRTARRVYEAVKRSGVQLSLIRGVEKGSAAFQPTNYESVTGCGFIIFV